MNVFNPSQEQQYAIDLCCDLTEPIASVTGGAGTGKSSILRLIHEQLSSVGHSIALAAPTGRAAKRIEELTGIRAQTIHRLLRFPTPEEDDLPNEPRHNRQNPLPYDVVIIDEASMLAPTLYRQLMDALKKRSIIRFFGDNNQLPPIEDGTPPFVNLLRKFPAVTLTFNFRSDDEIISNAIRILRGSIPLRNARFEILYTHEPIKELIRFAHGAGQAFTTSTNQIITPTRNGNYGTLRINPSLQVLFNGRGPILQLARLDDKVAHLTVRANDKFLWIKNDYGLALFNGEIGTIEWIDEDSGALGLSMPSGSVTVPPSVGVYSQYHGRVIRYDPRKHLEHGYIVTTHKAQGSEFNEVIYCISGAQAFMLNRRNFYTAITRARTRVIVIADNRAMSLSMRRV